MDVKQRAVLSSTPGGKDLVICAEPSPDALSVYAAGLSGSVFSGDKKAAEFALSQTETASFIGNRTETIQLLRDNLYRACEAYMGGAVSSEDYLALIRRYQVMTMGLLAIERLTGTVRPPNVIITAGAASASAGVSEDEIKKRAVAKADAAASLEASQDKLKQADAALDAAKKASTDAPADKDAKKALDDAVKAQAAAKRQVSKDDSLLKTATEAYDEGKGSKGASTRVDGGAMLSSPEVARSYAQAASAVATATQLIVASTINEGFKLERCLLNSSGCSFAQQQETIDAAAMACNGLKDPQQFLNCVTPIFRLTDVSPSKVREILLANRESASAATNNSRASDSQPTVQLKTPTKTMELFVQRVLPADEKLSYRIDVFAIPPRSAEQQALLTALEDGSIGRPRARTISPEDCYGRFNIDPQAPATIRYDDDSAEASKKDSLKLLIEKLLPNGGKVQSSAVETPTPFYLSVFLCKR
jgi:hypothetical protein